MAEEEVTRMYELLDALGEAIHATKLCFFLPPALRRQRYGSLAYLNQFAANESPSGYPGFILVMIFILSDRSKHLSP